MKIKDYKLFLENKQSREEINSICIEYNIRNYTINNDGTVDVDGHVNLSFNKLTKLPLKFGKVTGNFNCADNRLTSLEGCPKWVGGSFGCSDNQLISLEGPKYVGNGFNCSENHLTTLKGGPEIVIRDYFCYGNNIFNFKGFPEDFEGDLIFIGNTDVYRELENIPKEKVNKFIYWCNEYDAIDDQGKVIPERMEEVYQKIGLKYED